MLKVIVKFSEWLRGEGPEKSYLKRRADGKMCCIGLAARAAGIPDSELVGLKTPAALFNKFGKVITDRLLTNTFLETGERVETADTSRAMSVNDYINSPDSHKVNELMSIGEQLGIDFEFRPDE